MNVIKPALFVIPLKTGPTYDQKHLSLNASDGVERMEVLKSGFVHLNPGQNVSWHTTGQKEELLVILRGTASIRYGTQTATPITVDGPAAVYIPRDTGHMVYNNTTDVLEYVYAVAPIS